MTVEVLVGKACTRVYENHPENFSFEFEASPRPLRLSVDCLWRIVGGGRIECTSEDHGEQFGLPAPVDAFATAWALLGGQRVVAVRLRAGPPDLVLEFESGRLLEVLADQSGREPWELTGPGTHLVAVGSGGIADFSPEA